MSIHDNNIEIEVNSQNSLSRNILILTIGTRGDVQPYVALGKGLQTAGHNVTICTCSSFEPLITENGLKYAYMNNDFVDRLDSEAGREHIENQEGILASWLGKNKQQQEAKDSYATTLRETWEAAQSTQPDIIIYHPGVLSGPHIAEKLGVPIVLANVVPFTVGTGEMPMIGFPKLGTSAWYNRLTHKLALLAYKTYDRVLNDYRLEVLGLDKIKPAAWRETMLDDRPIPVLHGISSHVMPRPRDWPDYASVDGYWFLDDQAEWQPSAELAAFLAAGEPPVYIGFGSMAGKSPERLGKIAIEALQLANVRGIIATGWGGIKTDNLPESILKVGQVPHAWLFPQMAAVVHHGGAGTTAAGLRAGCPTIICPFVWDQPFWGARVHERGVGCKPIPHKQLTAEKLASAIREVMNPQIQQNAAALGKKIRAEDGIANAVARIEHLSFQRQ